MRNNKYALVCGMEVHVELKTKSKMFCGCKNDPFRAPKPNIYTCPICLGMPGALPVANKKAIAWTILLGLALNCKINLYSKFDRKNYFYPDLPKGYQISQYDLPFCYGGKIETSFGPIGITRIHLEEDTAKLLHQNVDGKMVSLLDFNRSSVPLMEVVTEPDIKSPEQAKEYAKKLRTIVRYLDIADCDMEQGGMRFEANTSLKNPDAKSLPDYKVEVKNINSFRFLEKAIVYEMERQEKLLEKGEKPNQETRGWNESKNQTVSQRSKENAEDYRYFPDPDLPPIEFTKEDIESLKNKLPELPDEKIKRWEKEYHIETKYSSVLVEDKTTADKLENIFKQMARQKLNINQFTSLYVNKKIMINLGKPVNETIESFVQQTNVASVDESALQKIIGEVIKQYPKAVEDYKAGKIQIINFLLGQVMRDLGKKVDSNNVREILLRQLQ